MNGQSNINKMIDALNGFQIEMPQNIVALFNSNNADQDTRPEEDKLLIQILLTIEISILEINSIELASQQTQNNALKRIHLKNINRIADEAMLCIFGEKDKFKTDEQSLWNKFNILCTTLPSNDVIVELAERIYKLCIHHGNRNIATHFADDPTSIIEYIKGISDEDKEVRCYTGYLESILQIHKLLFDYYRIKYRNTTNYDSQIDLTPVTFDEKNGLEFLFNQEEQILEKVISLLKKHSSDCLEQSLLNMLALMLIMNCDIISQLIVAKKAKTSLEQAYSFKRIFVAQYEGLNHIYGLPKHPVQKTYFYQLSKAIPKENNTCLSSIVNNIWLSLSDIISKYDINDTNKRNCFAHYRYKDKFYIDEAHKKLRQVNVNDIISFTFDIHTVMNNAIKLLQF